jgi:hypothetical protein
VGNVIQGGVDGHGLIRGCGARILAILKPPD